MAVVNADAYTAVDKAESEPDVAFAINRDGAGALAAAAARQGLPIVQISTDYVYTGDKDGPYVEADPVGPRASMASPSSRANGRWPMRTPPTSSCAPPGRIARTATTS